MVETKSAVLVTVGDTPPLTNDKWLLDASGFSFAMPEANFSYGADLAPVACGVSSAGGCPTLNLSRMTR